MGRGRPPQHVAISRQEQERLEALVRQRTASPRDVVRAQIVLMANAGATTESIAAALGAIARAQGMTRIAKETGLNREGLYKTLSGEGNPELDTLLKVIKAVGLQLHATLKAC